MSHTEILTFVIEGDTCSIEVATIISEVKLELMNGSYQLYYPKGLNDNAIGILGKVKRQEIPETHVLSDESAIEINQRARSPISRTEFRYWMSKQIHILN